MAQWVKNPPAMQETQEMQIQSLVREDPLEKEKATHSGILAWKIPWTEKLCGLYGSKGHKELDTTERVGEKFPGFGRESPCFTDRKIEVLESILVPWQMRWPGFEPVCLQNMSLTVALHCSSEPQFSQLYNGNLNKKINQSL